MIKNINILFTLLLLIALCTGQLENLGTSIQRQVQESLKPLEGLGSKIQNDVRKQMANVEKETQKIEENLRVIESIIKVKFGRGGTTVATSSPGDKTVVIINGEYYICDGTINKNNGECSEFLKKVQFQNKEDFCLVGSKNIINDWYCIAAKNNFYLISNNVNGQIICDTQDNSPKLIIKVKEFDDLCKNVATSINYKYFTNSPLTHVGNGLSCSGKRPQICNYSENLQHPSVNYHNNQVIIMTN